MHFPSMRDQLLLPSVPSVLEDSRGGTKGLLSGLELLGFLITSKFSFFSLVSGIR